MKFKVSLIVFLYWNLCGIISSENRNTTDLNGLRSEKEPAVHALSRRKRYIVFPKGSSLQIILELLVHVPTGVEILLGPTLQIAWPLPSEPLRKFKDIKRRVLTPVDIYRLENHVSHFKNVLAFEGRNNSSGSLPAGPKFKLFSDLASLLNLFGMTVGLAWQLPDDPMIYSEFKKKHKIYKRNVFKKMEAFMRPGGADGRHCVLRALCESGQRTPSKKGFVKEILHKIFSVNEDDEDDEETNEDKIYRKAHQSKNQNCETLYPNCGFSLFTHLN